VGSFAANVLHAALNTTVSDNTVTATGAAPAYAPMIGRLIAGFVVPNVAGG
jgi:hypothetical protein